MYRRQEAGCVIGLLWYLWLGYDKPTRVRSTTCGALT
jgi:hypothetical protein